MSRVAALFSLVLLFAGMVFLLRGPADYDWAIGTHPVPAVPDNNPMSQAKVELGRHLFYDTRLSVNGTVACATCHVQALAFTDGKPRSVGATGDVLPRSSMSLVNTAYASRLTWSNSLIASLEDQALTPLFADQPVEMGLSGKEAELLTLLQHDEHYAQLFAAAFPDDEEPGSIINMVRATSAFVRSIVSFRSPYDEYLAGNADAISEAAKRGEALFFSERLECFHCHGGFNFTDSTTHESARVERFGYHNTGLYNIGNSGAYPADNRGLADISGERRDMGRFRAPTLRNIVLTAPYMHDGSVETLDAVMRHYERGGRKIETGPLAGDGNTSPFKSEFVRGFEITDQEREDGIAVLYTQTDREATVDPRWSSPWGTNVGARPNLESGRTPGEPEKKPIELH
ncbi:MAG: MbnH family di-heme enzyme [Pseudomonadota bacterium]